MTKYDKISAEGIFLYYLAFVCAAFSLGAFFTAAFSLKTAALICAAVCFSLVSAAFIRHTKFWALCALCLFLGAGYAAGYGIVKDISNFGLCSEEAEITCEVVSSDSSVIVKTFTVNGKRVRVSGVISRIDDYSYEPGECFKITGKIGVLPKAHFYGGMDLRSYYDSKGVDIAIAPKKLAAIGTHRGLYYFAGRARYIITKRIYEALPGDKAALLTALTVGDKNGMSSELKDDLSKSSLSHITVVSGMHVSIIISMLAFLAAGLSRFRKTYFAVMTGMLCLFAVITGAQPSVLRAVIMAVTSLFAAAVYERYDPLTALMFSAAVLTAVNPFCTLNAGFQLSYCATFAIILCITFGIKRISYITCAIFILMLPMCLYYFNFAALSVFFTNLICAPLVGMAVPLGFLGTLIPVFNKINGLILYIILLVSKAFARADFLRITAPVPSAGAICGLYTAAAGFFIYTLARKRRTAAAFVSIGLILCIVCTGLQASPKVTVFNDGENVIHIKTQKGKNIICTADTDSAADYIEKNKITTIDIMFLTGFAEEVPALPETKILKLCMPKFHGKRAKSEYPVKYCKTSGVKIDETEITPIEYTPYASTKKGRRCALKISYNGAVIIFEPKSKTDGDIVIEKDKITVKNGLQHNKNMLYCDYDTEKCGAVTFKIKNGSIRAKTLR